MKALLEFFQSIWIAECIIIIALIAITAYGIFDARKADKEHKTNKTRFDKKYKR